MHRADAARTVSFAESRANAAQLMHITFGAQGREGSVRRLAAGVIALLGLWVIAQSVPLIAGMIYTSFARFDGGRAYAVAVLIGVVPFVVGVAVGWVMIASRRRLAARRGPQGRAVRPLRPLACAYVLTRIEELRAVRAELKRRHGTTSRSGTRRHAHPFQ